MGIMDITMPSDFLRKNRENLFDIGRKLPSNNKSKRDSKRTFNQTQRKEILYQQDNKCAICHEKLDPRDIEYHHKKPWASGGRTKTVNGRALCGSCHNIVEHKTNLKKADKKTKTKNTNNYNKLGLPDIKLPDIQSKLNRFRKMEAKI